MQGVEFQNYHLALVHTLKENVYCPSLCNRDMHLVGVLPSEWVSILVVKDLNTFYVL